MTITRHQSDGKPIVIDVKTWQFVASIMGIVATSLALATPWTRFQAAAAVSPRLDTIESQLKSASEKAAHVEERLQATKEMTVQEQNTTKDRLDRIESKLDRLLERKK